MNLDNKNLKAWLTFNKSPTEDVLLNNWQVYGNPTVGETNAFFGNALQLDGQSYLKLSGVELGGQHFCIDCWVYVDTTTPSYARIFSIDAPNAALLSVRKNPSDATKIDFWANAYKDVSQDSGYTKVATTKSIGERIHLKIIYRYDNKRIMLFVNDKFQVSYDSCPQYTRQAFDIYIGTSGLIGAIDEFRLLDGGYSSYGYETPPTVEEYSNITFSANALCQVRNPPLEWRYYNAGDADDLIIDSEYFFSLDETVSVTETAFYQTAREKCFDLPATNEIWMKFDVYFDGVNRWRAYNGGSNDITGITAQTSGDLSFFSNGLNVQQPSGICQKSQLQTVLLHMISGASSGVIEAWVDGEKIYRYVGDVNHGEEFADIYLQSDGSGTLFSNVTIANREIALGEGWQKISLDTARAIQKKFEISYDVQRILTEPIVVPLIGSHFNHFIESLNLIRGEVKKIILPKQSKIYVRANSTDSIKISSDTSPKVEYTNEIYIELGEGEKVFIEMPTVTTPQQVIRDFMQSLADDRVWEMDEKLAKALPYATGGRFETILAIAEKFMADLNDSASYTDFLREYCDIFFDNSDTGAISGSDAGGGIIKTAESIVPEPIPVSDWIMPEAGSLVTIESLRVKFPTQGASGTFTDAEKHILAGLNTVWIKQSLLLIKKSFGLSLPTDPFINLIQIKFTAVAGDELASVSYDISDIYSRDRGFAYNIIFSINMARYAEIDQTSTDGTLMPSSPNYYVAGYLDRTIAHELTHAVTAMSIRNFNSLPLFIKEGAAELVHGIDDLRSNDIVELLTTEKETLADIFYGELESSPFVYAGGYMFLRYFAKQGQNSLRVPESLEVTNLLISDGATDSNYEALTDNTRQIFSADVFSCVTQKGTHFFDVTIFTVAIANFFVDVVRSLSAKVKLLATDNSQYFSGGSEPIVIPTRRIPPAASDTSGLQSLEISIAAQQLTDQVSFTGINGFDIMQEFSGQYLDYAYNMRIEKTRQEGILYQCDCCNNIDELLYTQFNYDISADDNIVTFKVDTDSGTAEKYTGEVSDDDTVIQRAYAGTHLENIAKALNKKCVCHFDDFISDMELAQENVTYEDLISQLFGWTARLPNHMINCYLRGNQIIAIQRGKEEKLLDISSADQTTPIITREIVRTAWGSTAQESTGDLMQTALARYTGSTKGWKIFYPPPTQSADGKTFYSYKNVSGYRGIAHGWCLEESTTYNDDGSKVKVSYHYDEVQGIYTCTSETRLVYDAEGNQTEKTTTIHDRLTRSQQYTRTDDEDGNELGSAVGSNLPGFYNEWGWINVPKETTYEKKYTILASEHDEWARYFEQHNLTVDWGEIYEADAPNSSAFSKYSIANCSGTPKRYTAFLSDMTSGIPLTNVTFPVFDGETLLAAITALKWLNRRTKETVSVTLYDYPHLIDLNDRIIWNNNEYYLESNTAVTTPRISNEQNLILVRWY